MFYGVLFMFFLNSLLFGFALSADAFSISIINGINYPKMKLSKALLSSGMFAIFQALMPMLGWILATEIIAYFKFLNTLLPWISIILLFYLGIKMILDSKKGKNFKIENNSLSINELLIQSVATSIDALLVGLTISSYSLASALICSLIIALVTFIVCFLGVHCGKALGLKMTKKAAVLGGIVLILLATKDLILSII